LLKSDEPLVITGTVAIGMASREEERPTRELKVEEISRFQETRARRTRRVAVRLPSQAATSEKLTHLKQILSVHAGETPVVLELLAPGESETIIRLDPIRVKPTDALILEVDRLFDGRVAQLRG
jgi:DNA polymerase III alpha subunit